MEGRQGGRLVGGKAESAEPSLATLVHVRLQRSDEAEPASDTRRGPLTSGENDQGVEDLGLKAGRVGQGVVTTLDR